MSYLTLTAPRPSGACARCGEPIADAASGIEVFAGGRRSGDLMAPASELNCLRCWNSRATRPDAPKAPERPVARHPWADFAVSEHKTLAEAQERARKVAYYLGRRPEIEPRDPNSPGPFYCLDAAAVPGFKPARKNPFA